MLSIDLGWVKPSDQRDSPIQSDARRRSRTATPFALMMVWRTVEPGDHFVTSVHVELV